MSASCLAWAKSTSAYFHIAAKSFSTLQSLAISSAKHTAVHAGSPKQSKSTVLQACHFSCNYSSQAAVNVQPTVKNRLSLPFALTALSAGAAAVYFVSRADDDVAVFATLHSIPRTLQAAWWGAQASLAYKQVMAQYPDTTSQEHKDFIAQTHQQLATKLLHVCQNNGGVYIKAAQTFSTIQAVPKEYRKTLEVLQDQVEPGPVEDVAQVLQRELGAPASQLFAEFEPEARAAASLAQVHKARLHDGRQVAVKVQYLGLEAAVAADMATLSALSTVAAWLFPKSFELGWVLDDLRRNLALELDFRLEAENAAKLMHFFRGRRNITAPAVIPELSTKRVITMEWVEGCRANDQESMQQASIRPKDVAVLLLDVFAEMTYVHGFVHADPHPGNILVRPAPHQGFWWRHFTKWKQPQLVLLDHGLYLTIPDKLRQQYCQLWCSFVVQDHQTAVALGTAIAGKRGGELLPAILRPGGLKQVPPEERKRLRSNAGVDNLGDLGKLLEALPRSLVEILKVSATVRSTASMLGAPVTDRLRVNAVHALHGMAYSKDAEGAVEYIGDLQSRTTRMRISAAICALRTWSWLSATVKDIHIWLRPQPTVL
ncbi:TPA: hypothetical protein ACH3X3_004486 [Trebouxia sp. C0006]